MGLLKEAKLKQEDKPMTRKNKKPVIKAFKGLGIGAKMIPKMVELVKSSNPGNFKAFKQDAFKKFGKNPNFAKAMQSFGMGEMARMPEAKKMSKGGVIKRKRPIDGIAQRGRTRAK
tara:strand:+ start:10369 stop:10716 length:348 start_codon:yes stop_codon:yes gene_type:complete